jgi:hypothetical protein
LATVSSQITAMQADDDRSKVVDIEVASPRIARWSGGRRDPGCTPTARSRGRAAGGCVMRRPVRARRSRYHDRSKPGGRSFTVPAAAFCSLRGAGAAPASHEGASTSEAVVELPETRGRTGLGAVGHSVVARTTCTPTQGPHRSPPSRPVPHPLSVSVTDEPAAQGWGSLCSQPSGPL